MSLIINLAGKQALVTGVTKGIGAGIARCLAQAGCDVAGCGMSPPDDPGAVAFIETVQSAGRRASYFRANVSETETPHRLIEQAVDALGGLDVVVSNAGRNVFRGAADCSEADWQECMSLDLASHWRLARAARPHLAQAADAPGVVIVIGSNHAWSTIPGCFPYNVAKAGLGALVQSLAIEWGPAIRAVGVAPGFIDTAGGDAWFNSFPDPAAERAKTNARHPAGRIGTVDEIGNLCAFLASDLCGFITGTTVLADGGRSALMQDE